MLSVDQVCNLYAWLYTDLPVPAGTWDELCPVDGAYATLRRLEGVDYLCFRGSVTFLDWIEDLTRVVEPFHDPELGGLHPGFAAAVAHVQDRLDALVQGKLVVVGHSLGAGHAAVYAARRRARGLPVDRLLLFGAPRAGGAGLVARLAGVPAWSFRNGDAGGHDLVTDVPLAVPPLLDYRQPYEFSLVSASPLTGDRWGPFRYHHFGLYCRALRASGPAARSLAGYAATG